MIPLIWHYVKAFFWDQNAAKRFLIGFGALTANVIGSVAVFGLPTISAWSRKELLQHVVFVMFSTLATMLPGPAIAKPSPDLTVVQPKGFVALPYVVAALIGIMTVLLVARTLLSFGATSNGWMMICLPAGAAQAWLVWRVLR